MRDIGEEAHLHLGKFFLLPVPLRLRAFLEPAQLPLIGPPSNAQQGHDGQERIHHKGPHGSPERRFHLNFQRRFRAPLLQIVGGVGTEHVLAGR